MPVVERKPKFKDRRRVLACVVVGIIILGVGVALYALISVSSSSKPQAVVPPASPFVPVHNAQTRRDATELKRVRGTIGSRDASVIDVAPASGTALRGLKLSDATAVTTGYSAGIGKLDAVQSGHSVIVSYYEDDLTVKAIWMDYDVK